MRRVAPWGLLLMVACATLFPLASASTIQAQEGVVYSFQPGETYSWQPSDGNYTLILHTGPDTGPDGAVIDVSKIHPYRSHVRFTPNHAGTSFAVEIQANESKSIRIESGTGVVALGRPDLTRRPLNDPYDIEASGVVPLDACRLFLFSPFQMSEPYGVHGEGSGVAFRVYDNGLQPSTEAVANHSSVYSPHDLQFLHLYVQGCREAAGTGEYRIWVTYPEELPETKSTDDRLTPVLVTLAVVLVVAVVGVVMYGSTRK